MLCWTTVAIRSSRSEEMPTDSGLAVGNSCARPAAATNSRYKIARVFALRLMAVGNTFRPQRFGEGRLYTAERFPYLLASRNAERDDKLLQNKSQVDCQLLGSYREVRSAQTSVEKYLH